MSSRKASIKETGEELSQEDWARFDAAVAKVRAEQPRPLRQGDELEETVETPHVEPRARRS